MNRCQTSRGPKPELIQLPNFRQETEYLTERVQQFHERGTAWNEMAIVYCDRFMGKQICERLKSAQISAEWINESSESRHYKPAEDTAQEDVRLLYVAMTRAIERLVMTCDRSSGFVKRLEVALAQVA